MSTGLQDYSGRFCEDSVGICQPSQHSVGGCHSHAMSTGLQDYNSQHSVGLCQAATGLKDSSFQKGNICARVRWAPAPRPPKGRHQPLSTGPAQCSISEHPAGTSSRALPRSREIRKLGKLKQQRRIAELQAQLELKAQQCQQLQAQLTTSQTQCEHLLDLFGDSFDSLCGRSPQQPAPETTTMIATTLASPSVSAGALLEVLPSNDVSPEAQLDVLMTNDDRNLESGANPEALPSSPAALFDLFDDEEMLDASTQTEITITPDARDKFYFVTAGHATPVQFGGDAAAGLTAVDSMKISFNSAITACENVSGSQAPFEHSEGLCHEKDFSSQALFGRHASPAHDAIAPLVEHSVGLCHENDFGSQALSEHSESFCNEKDFCSQAPLEHSEGLCQEKDFSSQALCEHSEGLCYEKVFNSQTPFEHSVDFCHDTDFSSQASSEHSEGLCQEKEFSSQTLFGHASPAQDAIAQHVEHSVGPCPVKDFSSQALLEHSESFCHEKDVDSQAPFEHSEGLCQEKDFSSQSIFEHSEGLCHEKGINSQAPFEHSVDFCHEKDFVSQAPSAHSEGFCHEKDISSQSLIGHASPAHDAIAQQVIVETKRFRKGKKKKKNKESSGHASPVLFDVIPTLAAENPSSLKVFSSQALSEHSEGLCQDTDFSSQAPFEHSEGLCHEKDLSSQALFGHASPAHDAIAQQVEHSVGICHENDFSSQALLERSESFCQEKNFCSQAPFEHSEGLCQEKDFSSQDALAAQCGPLLQKATSDVGIDANGTEDEQACDSLRALIISVSQALSRTPVPPWMNVQLKADSLNLLHRRFQADCNLNFEQLRSLATAMQEFLEAHNGDQLTFSAKGMGLLCFLLDTPY